jgi:hypothetical protein
MTGEHKAWSLAILMACMSLVACIFIMARCSVDTAKVQTDAADCVKSGGVWHVGDVVGGTPAYCEEPAK